MNRYRSFLGKSNRLFIALASLSLIGSVLAQTARKDVYVGQLGYRLDIPLGYRVQENKEEANETINIVPNKGCSDLKATACVKAGLIVLSVTAKESRTNKKKALTFDSFVNAEVAQMRKGGQNVTVRRSNLETFPGYIVRLKSTISAFNQLTYIGGSNGFYRFSYDVNNRVITRLVRGLTEVKEESATSSDAGQTLTPH